MGAQNANQREEKKEQQVDNKVVKKAEFPTLSKVHKRQAVESKKWMTFNGAEEFKNTVEDFPALPKQASSKQHTAQIDSQVYNVQVASLKSNTKKARKGQG